MTVFEEGYLAYEQGKSIEACPYLKGSGYAILWRNGWREHRDRLERHA